MSIPEREDIPENIKEQLIVELYSNIYQEYDGWTIRTKDGKPSAHFEHTVVVRDGKADILSDFGMIEEVLKSKKS
jgi:methionine aminopeptidase